MKWLSRVRNNIADIVPAMDYYEKQLDEAKIECTLKGSVEKHSRDLPGIVEYRFNQLQEIESILVFLEIELSRIRSKHFKIYLEGYQRALSSRDAEKYADSEDEVVDSKHIINELALVRNKYLGLIKGIDAKQFQINNIVKLRVAGLEDVNL